MVAAHFVAYVTFVASLLQANSNGECSSRPHRGTWHEVLNHETSTQVRLPIVDVEAFGAVGDGKSDSTSAFKLAMRVLREASGGTLFVPCGHFVSGPLDLISNFTLYISNGAKLQASSFDGMPWNQWPAVEPLPSYGHGREGDERLRRIAFLSANYVQNLRITGDWGTVDGNGWYWWEMKWGANKQNFDGITLPHLLELQYSQDIEISKVHFVNSAFWTVHPFACSNVVVRDVSIVAPESVLNTDGVNPDSCENVLIENLVYSGGDDAVAIKSGWDCFGDERGFDRATRNVTVRNITVRTTGIAAAIAIGSEMSGGIDSILVDGGRIEKAGPSGGAFVIKSAASRGGYVRNVIFRNVDIGNIPGPAIVVIHPNDFHSNPACSEVPKSLPHISNVLIDGLRQLDGTSVGQPPVFFGSLEGQATVRDFAMHNVRLNVEEKVEGSAWKPLPACWGAVLSIKHVYFSDKMEPGNWLRHDPQTCLLSQA